MYKDFKVHLDNEIEKTKSSGLFKNERIITSPQSSVINTDIQDKIINLCSNNYLGLSSHPDVLRAAKESIDSHGFGMSSVRFICGTQNIHKKLEESISKFLGTEDTILYAAAFDANGGLFEPLFGPEDAIISDSLNHASIIDGIRLCKAKRFRYEHSDMVSLEEKLNEAKNSRYRVIVTDGVFSMDGTYAKLPEIVELAERYEALIMVDDCHATGFVGNSGKGSAEHFGLEGKIDFLTGTLGKALGGASGGFICAKKGVVELLKQKSRPYLFSNALSPSIVKATLKALELVREQPERRRRIFKNTIYFRKQMKSLGFNILGDEHPITPVMLGDANVAQRMSKELLNNGIYAVGFSFPVVPKGMARIRLQINSEHTVEELDKAIKIFKKVGTNLKVI